MDASKILAADPSHDIRVGRVPPAAALLPSRWDVRRRWGCHDVARIRAARYARRRRLPRPLQPLVAAFILIGLVFERKPFLAFSSTQGKAVPGGNRMPLASMRDDDRGIDRLPVPDEADGTATGIPEPRYRPPADFFATDKNVAQIVAFLIRNRGRLDNEAIRAKWALLDRASLPLAIFLREVEAAAVWEDLEKEILEAPPGTPAASISALPKSIRHRKLLRLLPEWTRRGEDILIGGCAADTSPDDAPTPDDDDSPDNKPRKP